MAAETITHLLFGPADATAVRTAFALVTHVLYWTLRSNKRRPVVADIIMTMSEINSSAHAFRIPIRGVEGAGRGVRGRTRLPNCQLSQMLAPSAK